MKKFILDNSLFKLFPEAEIRYFTVKNIDNHVYPNDNAYFTKLLIDAKQESKKYLVNDVFRKNPIIAEWRAAYQQFKKKKGARSSIEALLKRVSQDRDFQPIVPLVDIYNSISLRYGIPCGGENIDAMDGDMHLGVTQGNDAFWPLGSSKNEPTLSGEVCYYDNSGAICRCWNWREAQRTMLTEKTKNAVIVTESAYLNQAQRAAQGIEQLKNLIEAHFNVKTSNILILNSKNPSNFIK